MVAGRRGFGVRFRCAVRSFVRRVWSAMGSVALALQLHDRRSIHDSIQEGHRQGGVAEVVGPSLEVDVGHQSGRAFLAVCINDLVPQARGLRREAAFDAVKTKLVNLC